MPPRATRPRRSPGRRTAAQTSPPLVNAGCTSCPTTMCSSSWTSSRKTWACTAAPPKTQRGLSLPTPRSLCWVRAARSSTLSVSINFPHAPRTSACKYPGAQSGNGQSQNGRLYIFPFSAAVALLQVKGQRSQLGVKGGMVEKRGGAHRGVFVRHSHPPPLSRWEGQSWLLHCRPQCSQFIGCFTLLNQTKLSCSPITIAGHRSSLSFVFELSKAVPC